ncbi:hypothetical protein JD844_005005 [Phrynosoma platyrhinos]|uniref:Peptidyl-tRNA hydrolase n=1 Tax=Phrynosoma platyrhinos TaxID=52577 RepID=A0ABQ7SE06_PHRPL|nr:hypothetical protein JD844_005005 [Phrynosoma platyrhinos]
MHHPKDELRTAGKRVLVAGLGNYSMRGTRHSVGMAVLNHLANKFNVGNQWETDRQCHADIAIARLGDVELVLMKPRRFMNVNGLSIAGAMETYKLGVENIYLVHDDLDKPLGKSMVRLRVGIGRPVGEISVDHYVLSRFTISEQKILPHVFEKATEMLLRHIQQNYSNQKDPATSEKKEAAKAPLKTETHNHH